MDDDWVADWVGSNRWFDRFADGKFVLAQFYSVELVAITLAVTWSTIVYFLGRQAFPVVAAVSLALCIVTLLVRPMVRQWHDERFCMGYHRGWTEATLLYDRDQRNGL